MWLFDIAVSSGVLPVDLAAVFAECTVGEDAIGEFYFEIEQ